MSGPLWFAPSRPCSPVPPLMSLAVGECGGALLGCLLFTQPPVPELSGNCPVSSSE